MAEEFYIIKESGICYASVNERSDIHEDLKTSMLAGIDYGVSIAFNQNIQSMTLDKGKQLIWERCEIKNIPISFVTVFNDKSYRSGVLKKKISKLKKFLSANERYKTLVESKTIEQNSEIGKEIVKLFGN